MEIGLLVLVLIFSVLNVSNADLTDVITGPLRSGTTPPLSSLPSDISIYQGNDGDYFWDY